MIARWRQGLISVLLVFVANSATPAADQVKVIPLTAIDSYAPTTLWTLVFVEYFIPEVDRRLAEAGNFKIKWNKAFGDYLKIDKYRNIPPLSMKLTREVLPDTGLKSRSIE